MQWLIHLPTQTFAARRSVIFPTRWAIATCSAAFLVGACPLAVASAVISEALVHVYAHTCVHNNQTQIEYQTPNISYS